VAFGYGSLSNEVMSAPRVFQGVAESLRDEPVSLVEVKGLSTNGTCSAGPVDGITVDPAAQDNNCVDARSDHAASGRGTPSRRIQAA
jgi:hypothetical protein